MRRQIVAIGVTALVAAPLLGADPWLTVPACLLAGLAAHLSFRNP